MVSFSAAPLRFASETLATNKNIFSIFVPFAPLREMPRAKRTPAVHESSAGVLDEGGTSGGRTNDGRAPREPPDAISARAPGLPAGEPGRCVRNDSGSPRGRSTHPAGAAS